MSKAGDEPSGSGSSLESSATRQRQWTLSIVLEDKTPSGHTSTKPRTTQQLGNDTRSTCTVRGWYLCQGVSAAERHRHATPPRAPRQGPTGAPTSVASTLVSSRRRCAVEGTLR